MATKIVAALKKDVPVDVATERKVLQQALKRPTPKPEREEIAPSLMLDVRAGRAVLAGKAVNSEFIEA